MTLFANQLIVTFSDPSMIEVRSANFYWFSDFNLAEIQNKNSVLQSTAPKMWFTPLADKRWFDYFDTVSQSKQFPYDSIDESIYCQYVKVLVDVYIIFVCFIVLILFFV